MGCPVPKVRKTGAGAALLADPDRAVARRARGRRGGRGRCGRRCRSPSSCARACAPARRSGFELAHRLVDEAGVAAIAFHPRSAAVHHKGRPTTSSRRGSSRRCRAPVILTGGLDDAASVREAFERDRRRGRDARARRARQPVAVRAAARPARGRARRPRRCCAELDWTIDRAVEHLGEPSARRATCASSTPGTCRGSGSTPRASCRKRCRRAADVDEARALLARERRSLELARPRLRGAV